MNGKPWTLEHERLLHDLAGLISDAMIGSLTGHAAVTIRKRRAAQGLPAYHPARYGTWKELPDCARRAIAEATA